MRNPPKTPPWLEWWRIRRQLLKLKPKRTCTDCGFLAYSDQAASFEDRARFDEEDHGSPPGPVENWRCARDLWDWGLYCTQPNWKTVYSEATWDRRGCSGFMKWDPGRTPAQHFDLAKDRTEFRRKLILALLPLLYVSVGTLIGWLLPG